MYQKANLVLDGKEHPLDLVTGTDGKQGVKISDLYNKTGIVTIDPGFFNTAVGESTISRRDPEKGELTYRGFGLNELVKESTFVETSYLLIYGKLPTQSELADFSRRLSKHSMIHEDMINLFDGFPGKAHPLAILSTMVIALSSYYPEDYEEAMEIGVDQITRLLSKIRTIAAFSYKKMIGQPFVYPLDRLPYCSNFLHMLFTIPAEPHIFETSPEQEKILNQFLILYADHEQNVASTTVQMIGSTKANLFACVSAGISALWGSREGGQNVAAIELIDEIRGSGLSVKEWFAKHKTREDFTQSTIFGHSAYKVKSPRSVIAKELFHNYFWGKSNAYIDTVREIELYTLQDNYFIEKNLYPNLEFYSAVIFQSLGIPKSMFTVMQALGKLPGWLAHWRELRVTENYKKARPRQIYKGEIGNKYIKIEDRK